ncbi:MAG: hypothetical protein ACYTG0_10635 [Planctomycetota bacterium]|jgi:flagellar M-ring protein FliF
MDFLNKTYAQLKDLFLSMTPGARITSALLLAVVVVSLGYLMTHQIGGPDAYLFNGEPLPGSELNLMEAALGQEGLEYETDRNRLLVPRGRQNEYMAALAKHKALPKDFHKILESALDKGSAYESRTVRQQRIMSAKQEMIAYMIDGSPEIDKAQVMYTVEEKTFPRRKVYSASVTVQPAGGGGLKAAMASSIREFVASAISPEMEAKDVRIMDMNTSLTTFADSDGYSGPDGNLLLKDKRRFQQEYESQVLNVLGWIPTKAITVDVELDPLAKHEETALQHDPKTVQVFGHEITNTETREPSTPAGSFTSSSMGNMPRRLVATRSPGNNEQVESTERTEQALVSSTQTKKAYSGHTPKRVKVAVTVPTSYFKKVWRARNPTEPGQEPKEPEEAELEPIRTAETAKIKETVAGVLPEPEGVTDKTELVTVAEFQDILPDPIPSPGMGEKALTWLGHYWGTLGLIGLALFSLVMLRSMVQASPTASAESGPSTTLVAAGGEDESESEGHDDTRTLQRFGTSGASLKEELSDLVGEDPDAAASVLRNWIGSAT